MTVLTVLGIAATIFGVTYIIVARTTPTLDVAPGLLGAIVGAVLGFVSNLILHFQRSFEEGRANEAQQALARESQAREQDMNRQMTESFMHDAKSREYLKFLSNLMLAHRLRNAPQDSDVRRLARILTQMTLRGLGSNGKGSILWLLYHLDLISKSGPIVKLKDADLSGAQLNEMNLSNADLSGADLSNAYLQNIDLSGAVLRGVHLNQEWRGGSLSGADLSNADLTEATGIITGELEQQAKSLEGATLPDGSKHH